MTQRTYLPLLNEQGSYNRISNKIEPNLPIKADTKTKKIKMGKLMSGLYFEEFEEGQEFRHALTRTVTEHGQCDVQRHDPQPTTTAPG